MIVNITTQEIKNIVNEQTAQNNAWSAQQAQNQMDFQKMMSDTAHQREMADLQKAGLNPILAVGSQGASSASGAMGQTDQSGTNAIMNFLVKMIDNQNQLQMQMNSAQLQRELTEKSNALTAMIAEANRAVQLQSSIISANASQYASDMSYSATQFAKNMEWKIQNLIQDATNARQTQAEKHDDFIHINYPTTESAMTGALAEALDRSLFGTTYLGGGQMSQPKWKQQIDTDRQNQKAKGFGSGSKSNSKMGTGLGGSSGSGSGGGRAYVPTKKKDFSYLINRDKKRSRNYKFIY